jgi:hypothetical protein
MQATMNPNSYFETVESQIRDDRNEVADRWFATVVAIAGNQEPPAIDEVRQLLTDAGKSMDDLKADCQRYSDRSRLKATVAQTEVADDEKNEIERTRTEAARQLQAAADAFEAAKRIYITNSQQLDARRVAVDEAYRAAQEAKQRLIADCPHPRLQSELKAARAEIEKATLSAKSYQSMAATKSEEARRAEARHGSPAGIESCRQQAAQFWQTAKEREADAARWQAVADRLEVEMADV